MSEDAHPQRVVFISRAGEDREVALHVAEILRNAGYTTFLQDEDFGHTSFMERMAQGFRHVDRSGCLLALLSRDYQRKEHCLKEARYPLTADPANKQERLIVLRLDDTLPTDFLKDIPYVDVSEFSPTDHHFEEALVSAVERSFSRRRNAVGEASASPTTDARVEKLLTFLENEDSEEQGKAILFFLALFSIVGFALVLFEQALSVWNWAFGTHHEAIFDWATVLSMWFLLVLALVLTVNWQIRAAARSIEDAHLKISQLNDLRARVAAKSWKSEWFVRAVMQTATRNITTRR